MPAQRPPADGPELFFGLAGAVGTDLEMVSEVLSQLLEERAYDAKTIQLSELLDLVDWSSIDHAPAIDDSSLDRHISTRMDAGDLLRETLGRGDALALLAILNVSELRVTPQQAQPRTAYIFRSLKHPDEVETLREVYGPNFFLVSAYSPVGARAECLDTKIARDWERRAYSPADISSEGVARNLIHRDRREAHRALGQRLEDTFPRADFFVDARDRSSLEEELERFIELLFDHPFHTPTRDENAMFHAQAAGLRSAAPGRQVGCAITSADGDILTLGTNEVPKAGGGQYWPGDDPDKRDHEHDERDVSGTHKRTVIEQILRRLRERDWLRQEQKEATTEEFNHLLDGLRVQSLIEFERAVHAEMAAILVAANRGISLRDSYLYSTTFPCHECARHIIAAGVRRVIYIQPYPKSLAEKLHPDAIEIDPNSPSPGKVAFLPFVGVAPRRYLDLFTPSPLARKDADGRVAAAEAGWFPKGVPRAQPEDAENARTPDEARVESKASVSETSAGEVNVERDADESESKVGTEGIKPEGTGKTRDEGDEELVDLAGAGTVGLVSRDLRYEHTSDALYILREGNALVELEDALDRGHVKLE
jgi:deoxycytidylate deaminase